MRRLAIDRDWFRIPELLVYYDRQLAELGGECAPVTRD
jgi:hypothetical protein